MPTATAMTARPVRLPIVDALRGFAVAQMIVYHFIYDLNYFGWLKLRMLTDQPWTGWRTAIVTQFRAAGRGQPDAAKFLPARRARLLAPLVADCRCCPAGVCRQRACVWTPLHLVRHPALCGGRVDPRATPRSPWNLEPGCSASPSSSSASPTPIRPSMNRHSPSLASWLHLPRTEDYVPFFPWLGVVLIGAGIGSVWQKRNWQVPAAIACPQHVATERYLCSSAPGR